MNLYFLINKKRPHTGFVRGRFSVLYSLQNQAFRKRTARCNLAYTYNSNPYSISYCKSSWSYADCIVSCVLCTPCDFLKINMNEPPAKFKLSPNLVALLFAKNRAGYILITINCHDKYVQDILPITTYHIALCLTNIQQLNFIFSML